MFLPISSVAEDVGNGSWFLPCGQLHLQLVIQFLFICSLPMSQDIVAIFPVVILKLDKVLNKCQLSCDVSTYMIQNDIKFIAM